MQTRPRDGKISHWRSSSMFSVIIWPNQLDCDPFLYKEIRDHRRSQKRKQHFSFIAPNRLVTSLNLYAFILPRHKLASFTPTNWNGQVNSSMKLTGTLSTPPWLRRRTCTPFGLQNRPQRSADPDCRCLAWVQGQMTGVQTASCQKRGLLILTSTEIPLELDSFKSLWMSSVNGWNQVTRTQSCCSGCLNIC